MEGIERSKKYQYLLIFLEAVSELCYDDKKWQRKHAAFCQYY